MTSPGGLNGNTEVREAAQQYGRYRLIERIAVGGMAEIFRAVTQGASGFEKPVVIKKILPRLAREPTFVRLLINEARINAALSHRNIVRVHDLGISGKGEYFLVLELVDGRDLRLLIEEVERAKERGPSRIPDDTALFIAAEVCDGLQHLHSLRDRDGRPLGLVHRDVSPANILCSYAGEVKLMDFGIAKQARDASIVTSLKGKFPYMSPEQVRSQPLGPATDIFALGAVLYEMLLGRRPFVGSSDFEVLSLVRDCEYPPPKSLRPELPDALDTILQTALAPKPEARFPDCASFAAAIRSYRLGQPMATGGANELAELVRTLFPPRGAGRTDAIPSPASSAPSKSGAHDVIELQTVAGMVEVKDGPGPDPLWLGMPDDPLDWEDSTAVERRAPAAGRAGPSVVGEVVTATPSSHRVAATGGDAGAARDRPVSGPRGAVEADTKLRTAVREVPAIAAPSDRRDSALVPTLSALAETGAPSELGGGPSARPPRAGDAAPRSEGNTDLLDRLRLSELLSPSNSAVGGKVLPPAAPSVSSIPSRSERGGGGGVPRRSSGSRTTVGRESTVRLWLSGAVLGLLVAVVAVSLLDGGGVWRRLGATVWRAAGWGATDAPPPIATLQIGSAPPNAEVMLDGELLPSRTPLTTRVRADERMHLVELRLREYEPYLTKVTLPVGKTVRIDAQLAPAVAVLAISSLPPGGHVSVDGIAVCTAPCQVPGVQTRARHRVVIELEGYAPWSEDIVVEPVAKTTVTAKLSPAVAPADGRPSAGPGGSVGEAPPPAGPGAAGAATGASAQPPVRAGEATPGSAGPAAAAPPAASPRRSMGQILLAADTPFRVLLRGKEVSRGPMVEPLKLSPGRHELVIVPSGGKRPKRLTIRIEPGETLRRILRF
jgi:serine/threonine protein kinase